MSDIRVHLTKDHEELAALLRCLAEDTAAPESGALQSTWGQLETRLLAHMDLEEQHLLPLLEASDSSEVLRIRTEHTRIRELVAALGVAIELHTARQPAIVELIELLRQHAAHEDEVLYRLGSQRASASVQDTIAAALKAAARFAVARAVGVAPQERGQSAER